MLTVINKFDNTFPSYLLICLQLFYNYIIVLCKKLKKKV